MTVAPRRPTMIENPRMDHQPNVHGVQTGYDAVPFDMDGVVTNTASIHAAAWKALLGVYNRLRSRVHGRLIEEEHVVNAPNWMPVDVRIGEGPWWSSGDIETREERRELDLRAGVSRRTVTLIGPDAHILSVEQMSFVSMDDPHLAALQTRVTAVTPCSGKL